MSKFDFIKDKNIVPVHKTLTLEYEAEYSGTTENLDIRVYPYTVEEKLAFKNANDEGTTLMKSDDVDERRKGVDVLKEATYVAVLAILKKDDKNATMEHVKNMPESWLDKIIFKALEFEGIDEEQIKAQTQKKELDKL